MKAYCIPQTRVIYEILNTEAIVVDFNTGNYYALLHVAKQIWQLIEQKAPVEKMVQLLSECYQIEKESISMELEKFLDELLENGLIQPADEAGGQEPAVTPVAGWQYDTPRLQKYTDVQSLLLLDPIHEVSDVGWPAKMD